MSDNPDFLSGRNLTRGDYNESVNYDTPSNVRSQAADDDSSLSGAHGGSGYGQAGGYSSDQQRQQGKQSVADDYAGVPGAGRLGGESRGYERDNDEYDSSTDNPATGTQGGKPSLGEKVKGGVEKMAGKVIRDPRREVKGEQRQTGQF
ncbi:hypothetical protein BDN67DRAFT_975323 [Paxillus ammoniavirescens]|nr:hypothetical protein BDN67DRAFT_975323 [Paxillus ammoniavirescens]